MSLFIEDQDFIIRQVKQLAKGLGKFLGAGAIKDILFFEQGTETGLSDEEIESLVLLSHIEDIQEQQNLSLTDLAQSLSILPESLQELQANERFATPEEQNKLRQFVDGFD